MLHLRNFLKPWNIILSIAIGQFLFYGIYAMGFIPSFKITFVSSSIIGYFCLLIFYILLAFLSKAGYKTGYIKCDPQVLICKNKKFIYWIVVFYNLLALFGLIRLSSNLISLFGLSQLPKMILTDRAVDYLVYGSGNTSLVNFSIVAIILLGLVVDKKDRKGLILLLCTIALNFVYSSVLYSRIIFIQSLFFLAIIYVRRKMYNKGFEIIKLVSIIIMLITFLAVTSGYRDFDKEGYIYTDSKIAWGISRLSDYVISTSNCSLEIIDEKIDKLEINDTLFRERVSSLEYTNIGGFGQLVSKYGIFCVGVIIIVGILYGKIWILYDRGKLLGVMLYPILLYSIFELWRIFYLGTSMTLVLCAICIFTFVIIQNKFEIRDIGNYEE